MKYTVYNKETKEFEAANDCIVTQDGEVAFWDEDQGWSVYPIQNIFTIGISPDVGTILEVAKRVHKMMKGENPCQAKLKENSS